MSQRKAKEYRRAMEQYQGVAADVDDLKRRIGAMEVRHRREDQMAEAARRRARAAAREQQEQERVRAQEQAEAERREASRRRNERRRRIVRRRRITALAEALKPLGLLLADPDPRAQAAQKIRKNRIVGDGQIRPLKLIDGIKGERTG